MRGRLPIKDDLDVTNEDIANRNLILFGDPASNSILAQIADALPLQWSAKEIRFAGKTVKIGVGSIARSYTINPNGTGGTPDDRISIFNITRTGEAFNSVKVSWTLKNQELYSALAALGFSNGTIKPSKDIPFAVTITYDIYTALDRPDIRYSSSGTSARGMLTRPVPKSTRP